MKTFFLDTPQCVKSFYDRFEEDLRIRDLGYHNFHFVKPFPFYRTQEQYSVHFIVAGKGHLRFRQKTYDLNKFDVFILPPNELFSYYPDENDPWEYVFFDFKGAKVDKYLRSFNPDGDVWVYDCSSPNKLLSSFSEFFEKHKNDLPTSYFEVASLLFLLFDSLLSSPDNSTLYTAKNLVKEAKSLIRLKFFEADLSVKSIAEDLHVSHSHLSRKFKEETGRTMISYITEQRIKYAETLLKTTSLTATQIAYMAGFNEYTYFLMTFKQKNGMTTAEYRNSHTPPPELRSKESDENTNRT